jgi:acetylornithine deacetylase/succinyl-diaminopimelate desuccinylase-like protein
MHSRLNTSKQCAGQVLDKDRQKVDSRRNSRGGLQRIHGFNYRISKEDGDFEATVYRDGSGINVMEHGPVFMEREDKHVRKLSGCIKRITGSEGEQDVFPGWTEASLLANFGNIPTLIFGAGDISTAHSEKEYINIDDLYTSALVYGEAMLNYEKEGEI